MLGAYNQVGGAKDFDIHNGEQKDILDYRSKTWVEDFLFVFS